MKCITMLLALSRSKHNRKAVIETIISPCTSAHFKPHCVKSVRIRIFSGLYFPAFGLNAEIYTVNLGIQSE